MFAETLRGGGFQVSDKLSYPYRETIPFNQYQFIFGGEL